MIRPLLYLLAGVVLVRSGVAWAAEELARRSAAGVITGLRRSLLLKAAALGPRWRSGTNGGRLAVLAGGGGPVRDAVLLNAAAAIAAFDGRVQEALDDRIAAGLVEAADAIDSGASARLLTRWIAAGAELRA